ncbi:hypothetical protein, partial [Pseudomonas aeruginosa]
QGRGLSFELGGKRTSLLAHQTPLSRRGFSPKSVSGISRPLHMALSPDGVKALGLDAKAIFDDLGLLFVEGDDELAWRFLQREVDPVDIAAIRKIAFWRRRRLRRASITASDQLSAELLSIMEKQLRSPEASLDLARIAMELLNNDTSPPGH